MALPVHSWTLLRLSSVPTLIHCLRAHLPNCHGPVPLSTNLALHDLQATASRACIGAFDEYSLRHTPLSLCGQYAPSSTRRHFDAPVLHAPAYGLLDDPTSSRCCVRLSSVIQFHLIPPRHISPAPSSTST
ncbi:hypothetical protein B0H16DRAFT_1744783 [Mycena metata]|uniref:Uncharacterized protein n=1 Tax=Mycena metata TaxID=1033252 RepID=A0AAD7H4L1_9AGAR|nr:hypothetical protein B0H16DRAFT_1744783 [Mycena metata]